MTLNFGAATDADRLTGAATLNSVAALSQDGSAIGSLVSFSVGQNGLDQRRVLERPHARRSGRSRSRRSPNPAGLLKQGSSLFTTSANSGVAADRRRRHRAAAARSRVGTLEGSNVDLGQEFTNMIIAQRGFEANAKVITTSDQLLQDLVNLKQ